MTHALATFAADVALLAEEDYDVALHAECRLRGRVNRFRRNRAAAVELLIVATRHPNPQSRWRAAYLLGRSRLPEVLGALTPLVEDANQQVQKEALEAIGCLRCEEVPRFLIGWVRNAADGDPRRDWACIGLPYHGETAAPGLLEVAREGSLEARCAAAAMLRILQHCHPRSKVIREALAAALHGAPPEVARAVEEAVVVFDWGDEDPDAPEE